MSHGSTPPPSAPTIRYLLIPVLGAITEHKGAFGRGERIAVALMRMIGRNFDEPFERVRVLYEGEYRDMFVGETSAVNGRHIRNIRATEIYRNNTLLNVPNTDPESLPAISGPAIIFPDHQVWK